MMDPTFVLWLLRIAARNSGQHLQYQANTIKDRNVLSTVYLGLRVASDRRFQFKLDELKDIAGILVETISGHGDG
ncbi:MAG: hypothetical protein OEX12_12640 [Gammaproteobacteria bacterium]|nr:hypothetical protein [Gammaproteobacteria bacterium]